MINLDCLNSEICHEWGLQMSDSDDKFWLSQFGNLSRMRLANVGLRWYILIVSIQKSVTNEACKSRIRMMTLDSGTVSRGESDSDVLRAPSWIETRRKMRKLNLRSDCFNLYVGLLFGLWFQIGQGSFVSVVAGRANRLEQQQTGMNVPCTN